MTEQMDEVASDVFTMMFTRLGSHLIQTAERDIIRQFVNKVDTVCGEFIHATYDDPMAQGSKEFRVAQQEMFSAFEVMAKQIAREKVYNRLYLKFKEVVDDK
jgi:hypothetical protein